jgi:hypothetical protein
MVFRHNFTHGFPDTAHDAGAAPLRQEGLSSKSSNSSTCSHFGRRARRRHPPSDQPLIKAPSPRSLLHSQTRPILLRILILCHMSQCNRFLSPVSLECNQASPLLNSNSTRGSTMHLGTLLLLLILSFTIRVTITTPTPSSNTSRLGESSPTLIHLILSGNSSKEAFMAKNIGLKKRKSRRL